MYVSISMHVSISTHVSTSIPISISLHACVRTCVRRVQTCRFHTACIPQTRSLCRHGLYHQRHPISRSAEKSLYPDDNASPRLASVPSGELPKKLAQGLPRHVLYVRCAAMQCHAMPCRTWGPRRELYKSNNCIETAWGKPWVSVHSLCCYCYFLYRATYTYGYIDLRTSRPSLPFLPTCTSKRHAECYPVAGIAQNAPRCPSSKYPVYTMKFPFPPFMNPFSFVIFISLQFRFKSYIACESQGLFHALCPRWLGGWLGHWPCTDPKSIS